MVQNIKNYIKKAYNIDLISISPISNQYSSVYKVSTKSASYALLLYRPNKKPEDIRSELTVYKYLNSVREGDLSFPNPLEADLAIDELKLKGRFALLYDWVEHLPYGNDPYQKEQGFTSYCYLNNLMKGINYNDYSYTKTGALDGAFDSLSKNYTDLNFTKFSNDKEYTALQSR